MHKALPLVVAGAIVVEPLLSPVRRQEVGDLTHEYQEDYSPEPLRSVFSLVSSGSIMTGPRYLYDADLHAADVTISPRYLLDEYER